MLASGVQFDVLFTDIRMPGDIHGVDPGKYAAMRHPELRVVYTSAFSERMPHLSERERFLPKPYTPEGLDQALAGLGVKGSA